MLTLRRPPLREPAVVDAARSQRAASGVGDDRQRRDRGEVRRLLRRDEQLRDSGIRDADHADRAVLDPRLRGDRLDDVVAVGRLQRLEELERSTRASGAADVHADGREAERTGDQRARLRRRGIRGRVAGVFDDRRVGAGLGRTRERHVDREQGSVARLEVAVPGCDRLSRVEGVVRNVARRGHVDRRAHGVGVGDAEVLAGRDVAKDQAALGVGGLRVDQAVVAVDEAQLLAGIRAGQPHLLHAPMGDEGRGLGAREIDRLATFRRRRVVVTGAGRERERDHRHQRDASNPPGTHERARLTRPSRRNGALSRRSA